MLHADVKQVSVQLTIGTEPARDLRVYRLEAAISCPDCLDDFLKAWEDDYPSESAGTPDGRGRHSKQAAQELDNAWQAGSDDVTTLLFTDFVKVWFACFCDKCGRAWLADEDNDPCAVVAYIVSDLRRLSGREFARQYAPMLGSAPWVECEAMAAEAPFNLTLSYETGLFLDQTNARRLSDEVVKVRQKVVADTQGGNAESWK